MNVESIQKIAEDLLATEPDTPVRFRLLRDVFRNTSRKELQMAAADLKRHPTYAMLQNVCVVKSPGPLSPSPISRPKGTLREYGDVFRVARNIGLTREDPHVSTLIGAMASYHEMLVGSRPWNDPRIRNDQRFFLLDSQLIAIPGALALICPDHPIVIGAREKAVTQVKAHYDANDFSSAFEDRILPELYGADGLTEDTVTIRRNMAYCTTDYSSIYRHEVFRLVGTGEAALDDETCRRYCDHMLRRYELIKGWSPAQDQIISGTIAGERRVTPGQARPDVFSREIVRFLLSVQDLMLYPCWRELVAPLVNWLWGQQQDDGFWDFGAIHNGSGDADRFRLSRNWRNYRRYQDWTVNILLILKEFYCVPVAT